MSPTMPPMACAAEVSRCAWMSAVSTCCTADSCRLPRLHHRLGDFADRCISSLRCRQQTDFDQGTSALRFQAGHSLRRNIGSVFDHFERPAVEIENRIVGSLDPNLPPPFPMRLYSAA